MIIGWYLWGHLCDFGATILSYIIYIQISNVHLSVFDPKLSAFDAEFSVIDPQLIILAVELKILQNIQNYGF